MIIFGGHRLWHGFATDNSESNSWSSYDEYPEGGYLKDLWVYTKRQLEADEQVRAECCREGGTGGATTGGGMKRIQYSYIILR